MPPKNFDIQFSLTNGNTETMTFDILYSVKNGDNRRNRVAIPYRSKVISSSSLLAVTLNIGRRPRSGNIGGITGESGIIENMGVAVEIASLSRPSEKLFLLPVWRPPF